MTKGILQFGPALLTWTAVIFKLSALRRSPGNPARRAYWLAMFTLALALTVLLPPVHLAIDRAAGIPNLARLLGHGLALAASWAVQAFLVHLNYPGVSARRKTRRYGWGLAGTLVLMATLFALAPVDDETMNFMGRYAEAPLMLEYWLAFLAYLGLAQWNVARLSWRYARLTDRPTLSLGLRLTGVGGLFGLAYGAHEGLYLVLRRLDLGYPLGNKEAITQVLLASAIAFIVIGSTMPAWGPRVGLPALWRWIGRYRAYRRLYPLWLALCRSTPEIALIPPSSSVVDALTVRDLDFRLYRRVIEIRDGRLALRAYLDPRAADAAHDLGREAGLSGEELQVLVEATSLAAALRAKGQRRPSAAHRTFEAPGWADVEGEVVWLEKVASCYGDSPLVPAALARLWWEHASPLEETSGHRSGHGHPEPR
jgi:hypothetical protein